MGLRVWPNRWILDESGAHSVEMALAIALFALIAAFGFFAFAENLVDLFAKVGTDFKNAALKISGV